MLKIIKKHSTKILWVSIIIYILLFSFLSLKKYYAFGYNAFDLAIFNQVFFNTAEGRWFDMTINLNSYLADHFTPIIFLLLPIYKLIPRPETLLILQTVILALSAWPLYKISEYISKDSLISLVVAILWLVNPFIHNVNIFEFHLLPIAIFLFFWLFYFYQTNNFKLFVLFFILSLLVREDIALIVVGFSILSFLDKRSWKWRLLPLFGLIYFFGALKFISSVYQGDNYKFIIYYSWLGGNSLSEIFMGSIMHPIKVLLHVFSFQNISTIFILLLTFLFLPLISPRYFWLAFVPFMQFALTVGYFNMTVVRMHYGLYFLPTLFISNIFSLDILKNKKKFLFSKHIYANGNIIKFIFIFTIIYFSITLSPIKYIFNTFQSSEVIALKKEFLSQIPNEASVMSDAGFASVLSNRQSLYPMLYSYLARTQFYTHPFEMPEVDYILWDNEDFFDILVQVDGSVEFIKKRKLEPSKLPVAEHFRILLDDYNLIKIKNGILLWQNKKLGKDINSIILYNVENKEINFDNEDFFVDYNFEKEVKQNILSLTFQKKQEESIMYLVRFYKDEEYFDVALDYGILPEKYWEDNYLYTFYYYLSKDVQAYQVFEWKGNNTFGKYKEVIVNKQINPKTDIISIDKL
mgnify:CR=1 FL=1